MILKVLLLQQYLFMRTVCVSFLDEDIEARLYLLSTSQPGTRAEVGNATFSISKPPRLTE